MRRKRGAQRRGDWATRRRYVELDSFECPAISTNGYTDDSIELAMKLSCVFLSDVFTFDSKLQPRLFLNGFNFVCGAIFIISDIVFVLLSLSEVPLVIEASRSRYG